jgi:hypothetical protein
MSLPGCGRSIPGRLDSVSVDVLIEMETRFVEEPTEKTGDLYVQCWEVNDGFMSFQGESEGSVKKLVRTCHMCV